MTSVTLLRMGGRADLARTIERVWDDGRAVWVLDPSIGPSGLASLGAGVLDAEALDRVVREGRADLDLPVPADTATIVTSSGTTSTPKVLCLSTSALDASGRGAHAHLDVGEGDRWGLVLPLHHVAGQGVLWRSRMLGTPPLVQDRLDVVAANRAGVTVVSLVPTQLRRIVDAGLHLDAHVLLGGAAIAPSLVAAGAQHVDGVTRSYGLTETCGGCVYDGHPFPGVEVAVRDARLGLRGPVLASGRLTAGGTTPITDADGWLWTNDLGAVTDGVVTVVGRADDVVITGGVNVAPAGVEVVLEEHPAVVRAGVVGLDDEEWGQRLVAALVLSEAADGGRPVDRGGPGDPDSPTDRGAWGGPAGPVGPGIDPELATELQAMVRAQVGAAAVPRAFVAVAELPLTSLGKVRHAAVRDLLARR